jgi:hypothetical protein
MQQVVFGKLLNISNFEFSIKKKQNAAHKGKPIISKLQDFFTSGEKAVRPFTA